MRKLAGRVAVITGAASGIGRAMADAFAAQEMKLVLADVEQEALGRAAAELEAGGAEVAAVPTDVTRSDQVARLADATLDRFGSVHVICNNAGVAPIGPILETTLEDWRWVLEVNVLGVVHGIAAFGPLLVEQGEGHIVNTASSGGLITVPGFGAYVATKHAVVGLSETLHQELAGTGVGVSVLCPGLVATRIFESERNRPGDGGPTHYGEAGSQAQQAIETLGAPPAAIAEHVVQGIREQRLHILPSPEVRPILEERFRCILAGENPAPLTALPETGD